MMSSPWASLIICILYVVIVEWALPRYMDKRKPLEFRSVIVIYNFAMVLLSGYIFVEVFNHILVSFVTQNSVCSERLMRYVNI